MANSANPNAPTPAVWAASEITTLTGLPVSSSRPPGAARERQRHQQPRGLQGAAHRHHDGHRQQRGHRAVEPDQRGEPGREQHRVEQELAHAGPRPADHGLPDPRGHAGGVQALADHEERPDQQHRGVGETGQGLGQGDDPQAVEHQGGADGDDLHRDPVGHEQHHHARQGQQGQRGLIHAAHPRAVAPAGARCRAHPVGTAAVRSRSGAHWVFATIASRSAARAVCIAGHGDPRALRATPQPEQQLGSRTLEDRIRRPIAVAVTGW